MATETIVPSAPAAVAPASAPSSAPAAAPASAAARSAANGPAPSASNAGSAAASGANSPIDPRKYPIREDYAKALLDQKLAAIEENGAASGAEDAAQTIDAPMSDQGDGVQESRVAEDTAAGESAPASESVAAENAPDPGEAPPGDDAAAVTEEDFELEPEAPITPEALSEMVKGNEEFGRLLDSDPKLKGQLYKTAREAAELQPYRELFPDLGSAKTALDHSATWVGMREMFLGSTTREGTLAALSRMAELSYESAPDGGVLMENGRPVIGEDFYGFVENVTALDLEHRTAEVEARLQANVYRSPQDRERDETVKAALEILREESADTSPAKEELPDTLRHKQEALDRRERELNERMHGERLQARRSFEAGLQQEAQRRIGDGIEKILANVEKQGAVVSPYLKNILPKAIGAKLVRKIQANPTLQGHMQELQRLPVGDMARERRLAAIDRAVQQYLPEIAREELREAGVQIATSAAAKRAKLDAQIDATRRTEPKGSTGPASGGAKLTASAAFDHARGEWQRANPGRVFDNVAKEQILPRVLQLMSPR